MKVGQVRIIATAALLALAGTACASPSVTPSQSAPVASQAETPAPTPPGGLVTSVLFGYSLDLPPGWVYRPATEIWPVRTYPTAGAPYTDNWERLPGPFPVIDISTQVLPADQTEELFMAALDEGNAAISCSVAATEEITVDGATGRFQRQSCAGGSEVAFEVTVFDGNRVYLIYWIGLTEQAAEDEPVFRQILATFRFAPGG